MQRTITFIFLLLFANAAHAEERAWTDDALEYLPDAAATEAARKGDRRAKSIQKRRKERGTAGRVAVDTPRYVSQIRADERDARHAQRSEIVQVFIDGFSDPRVRVLPILTRKSVGLRVSIAFGKQTTKAKDKEVDDSAWSDDAFAWMDNEPEEDEDDAPKARRSAKRWAPLTTAQKTYIDKDNDQRRNRKKLRARD